MGIYGQDWASYQGSIPSTTGLDFVFLKVTEGLSYESPVWKAQYMEAKKTGLVVGFYHYPHMHNNPDTEVNYFLSKVTPKAGELVVLDWEGYDANNRGLSASEQLAYKEEYLRFIKSKLPNNPVGLYCNTDYWLRIDKNSHAGDFLWIATGNKPAGQPGIQYAWKFHQYGASGVDKDYGNFASRANLIAWANSFNKTTAPSGEDMALTKEDAQALWSYSHGDKPDVHQTLASAAADAASAKAGVSALQAEFAALKADLATSLSAAVKAAIAQSTVTATVQVNGKVV